MTTYKLVDGKRVAMKGDELADFLDREANPPPSSAPPTYTYKADIWRRCTDDEFVKLKAALDQAPPRMRQIFADATRLVHDDPDFAQLRGGIVAAVGEARADELLAPSEDR